MEYKVQVGRLSAVPAQVLSLTSPRSPPAWWRAGAERSHGRASSNTVPRFDPENHRGPCRAYLEPLQAGWQETELAWLQLEALISPAVIDD
jgi:hypothetical protein